MTIEFSCPECGGKSEVSDEFGGRHARCESCGAALRIRISRPLTFWRVARLLLIGTTVVGIGMALLLPTTAPPIEAHRRMACFNNLKNIGLAMHHYHDRYKSFPPANLADGEQSVSWRKLLIPFLTGRPALAAGGEPDWESPELRAAFHDAVATYACRSDPANTKATTFTNYVVLTGPETIFEGAGQRFVEMIDGTSNTIMVVELRGAGIRWDGPQNLHLEAFVAMFGPHRLSLESSPHPGGMNVLMADGSVHFLAFTTAPETVRALATSRGGERIDAEVFPF